MSITVHERRAARTRWLAGATPMTDFIGTGVSAAFSAAQAQAIGDVPPPWERTERPDLHARRASRELQRMWLRELHRMIRKARRFRGVRKRYAEGATGREIANGWYVE